MSIFPIINPFQNPNPEENNPRLTGGEADPTISAMASQYNPYAGDLALPVAPELAAYNEAITSRTYEVAQLEETDKALKALVDLDKKGKTAQTNIHKTMSDYQQYLVQNANKLQEIGLAHQLAMAGLQGQSQQQQARFSGLASARAAIANRMRQGAA